MKYLKKILLFPVVLLLTASSILCTKPGESGKPGFRIRSDFTATLNSDEGWAGAPNENVTVFADQPFRIRFELESPAEPAISRQFRLQYRRNSGVWTDIEAHDFPHPERDISVNFSQFETGMQPAGWTVFKGNSSNMVVTTDNEKDILHIKTDQDPFVGLFTPPWEATELASQFRLTPDNHNGIAFVMGYVDSNNYCLVQLDPTSGTIRVSRVINGRETVLAERNTEIPFGQWLEIEIGTDNREIEVNFQDDMLEMDVRLEADIPLSKLGFQVPSNGAIDFQEFSFAGEAQTPRVSIVTCPAYEHGMSTKNLLKGSAAPYQAGAGISFAEQTPVWSGANAHGEFEWPVVIRRFADGAVTNNEGDTFEFRMVDAVGAAGGIEHNPVLRLSIPPGHVGGTFIENPGRIGPWQASNGDLYFMMEPAETENVFMMIKSTDNGRTWREVDGANRPRTNDLESVDSRLVGDTIHIIHQVTHSVRYHTFRTSDHPTHPDTWAIRDELAGTVDAIAQTASMVVRSDRSIVAFYLGQEKIHYSVRSQAGVWSRVMTLDPDLQPNHAGPQAVLGANDIIHLVYYGTDGTIWYRRFLPDGTLTPRQLLATGAGTSRAEYGAVLPLVFIPNKNEVVIIYRLASGNLWERRIVNDAPPTEAVMVTDRKVVTDAVDSQQAGADAVLDGETIYVMFIEESSRSIFSTNNNGGWQSGQLRVDNILGSWVRGNVYTRKDGVRVYGYVYDAGSDGGSGLNRFKELILNGN
ncbi:hypothetical protein JXQ31_14210 [candidate division KSB1 bacterium]|nr:hypothetical protein [candidate division KSB1 bacterium]